MQDAKSFENFVRGLSKESFPFKITEIIKRSNTAYDVFIDLDKELMGRVVMPPEMAELVGEPPEKKDGEHDMRVLVSFFPEANILSMGVYVETGLPSSSNGWLLSCLNTFHHLGMGYSGKVSVPDPTAGEKISIVVGWEVGLYQPELMTTKGLRFLKILVSGMLFRLCVESPSISIELTKLYRNNFPAGMLNA